MNLREYSRSRGYKDFWLFGFVVASPTAGSMDEVTPELKEKLDDYIQRIYAQLSDADKAKTLKQINRGREKYEKKHNLNPWVDLQGIPVPGKPLLDEETK